MAGSNEEVIGARFEIDVTDLKNGIKQANQAVRLAESQFKAAASGMDDWRTSEEGLNAKLTQLNRTAEIQDAKVRALTQEYNRLAQEYGENSSQAQAMAIRVNNATAALNKTQREAKDVEQSLSRLGTEARDTAQDVEKLGRSGDGVSRIGSAAKGAVGGIAALAGAAVGMVAGLFSISDATQETVQNLGQLEVAFTSQGHSVETAKSVYSDFYGLLGEGDTATEAANNLARLTTNTDEMQAMTTAAAGAFAQMGDALPIENLIEGAQEAAKTGTLVGGLTDAVNWSTKSNDEWAASLSGNQKAQDAFNQAIAAGETREDAYNAALAACSTEQERATLITQSLSMAYGEAGEQYLKVNENLIAARKAQADFEAATAEAGKAIMPLQTNLMSFAASLVNGVVPDLEQVGEGIKTIFSGDTQAGAQQLSNGISGAINGIVSQISASLPQMMTAGTSLISGLINGIVTALPNVISGLASSLPSLLSGILSALNSLIASLTTMLPQLLTETIPVVISSIGQVAQQLIMALPQIVTGLVSLITAVAQALPQFIPLLIDGAIQLFLGIVQALPIVLPQIVTAVVNAIPQIVTALIACIPQLLAGAIQLFMALVQAVPQILGALLSAVSSLIGGVLGYIPSFLGSLLSAAQNLFMGIAQAVPQVAGNVVSAVGNLLSQIPGKIAGFAGNIASAAGDMIQGMIDGILGAAGGIASAVQNLCSNALDGIKSFFGIHSPSRVMKKLFKKDWGGGIVQGIKGAAKDVAKATQAVNKAAIPDIDTSGVNYAIAGANGRYAGAQSAKNITFVQNNYSPKALSAAETYRQGLKLSQTLAAGV